MLEVLKRGAERLHRMNPEATVLSDLAFVAVVIVVGLAVPWLALGLALGAFMMRGMTRGL
jgi:hypothetical protein